MKGVESIISRRIVVVVERGRREVGMGRRAADENGEEGSSVHLK
jgi:hypothetical protein